MKIGIVGSGMVGSTAAYVMVLPLNSEEQSLLRASAEVVQQAISSLSQRA